MNFKLIKCCVSLLKPVKTDRSRCGGVTFGIAMFIALVSFMNGFKMSW
jgi:hypothetical protein